MTATLKDSIIFTGILDGLHYERENPTESYVEIPPAKLITDGQVGADGKVGIWSFGNNYVKDNKGNYEFNVIRNDVDLDEYAQKIVYQRGKVRIFGRQGWRVWNGRTFI